MPRHPSSALPTRTPLALEEVALADLKPHPQNYREHPADQLEHLQQSLQAFGVYKNIVIARDNTILAGHGLVESARALGMTSFPVKRLDLDPHETQALRVLVGDNEIARLALLQESQLAALLTDLAPAAGGLAGTGFDPASLAALLEHVTQATLTSLGEIPAPGTQTSADTVFCPKCGFEFPYAP
jgi:ParB-like chromosome segregation protein Spo0J